MAQAIRTSRLGGRPVADPRHITRSDLFDHPRRFRGRHHAATIFVVLLLAVFGSRLFPQKDVTVLINGQAYRVSATFDTESEALAAADVSLSPGDRVLFADGGRHSSVSVQRARDVSIKVDGREIALRTQAATVAGALVQADIELHPGDHVLVDGQPTTERGPLLAAAFVGRPVGAALAGSASDTSAPAHIEVVRARRATVMVDTMRVELSSAAATVDGLLTDLGMTVREGDLVRPALDSPVTAGMVVRLAKARTVNVRLDGKDQALYTQAQTVADIVRVLGIELGPEDLVSLPLDTPVQNGMAVTIGRTLTTDEEVRDPVQPTTVYESDTSLGAGQTRIIPGVEGVRVSHYRVTYKNGVVSGRVLLDSAITQQPVATRHIEGSKPSGGTRPTLNAPGYTGTYVRKMNVVATWYNASQGAWAADDPNYGRTATGVMVGLGICAVDPTVIPLGTRFYVEGYGNCVAADTGGLIKGNIIDLGYPESVGDPGWGKRAVEVYILD